MLNDSPALRIENLNKSFGSHRVLHQVALSVERGSIHGLVGLNGAGKTTTLECTLGLQRFDSGSIQVIGVEPDKLHTTKGKLAVVFDAPCIHPNLTVRQVLEHARLLCGTHCESPAELEQRLNITRYRDFKINQLSLGNRRRTAIAQALIGRPEFLVLDEPFNGLDAGGVDDVLDLILELNRQQGTTLLLASHQLSYLERVCSHMAFLHQGEIAISESMNSLLARHQSHLLIRSNQPERVRDVIQQADGVSLSATQPAEGIAVTLDGLSAAEVNRLLVQAGVDVNELIQQNAGLEAMFRSITGDSRQQGAA